MYRRPTPPHFETERKQLMNPQKRILMIATSNTVMGNSGKLTGIWADELAVPYYLLTDAGADVVLASPLGGPVTLDPGSIKPAGQNDPLVDRFLTDPVAQAKALATHCAAQMDASSFDAVFFPGGHGTMWDLPTDAGVTRAVEAAFAAGKLIASVCHGAAGLVTARRRDGEPVVKGLRGCQLGIVCRARRSAHHRAEPAILRTGGTTRAPGADGIAPESNPCLYASTRSDNHQN
ncbi:MAG: intracellular protease/amidase [Comamonadaceae bacterium]|nr:MAG: intracellular protease/amidase [Comamonadaceae bacterium]